MVTDFCSINQATHLRVFMTDDVAPLTIESIEFSQFVKSGQRFSLLLLV